MKCRVVPKTSGVVNTASHHQNGPAVSANGNIQCKSFAHYRTLYVHVIVLVSSFKLNAPSPFLFRFHYILHRTFQHSISPRLAFVQAQYSTRHSLGRQPFKHAPDHTLRLYTRTGIRSRAIGSATVCIGSSTLVAASARIAAVKTPL